MLKKSKKTIFVTVFKKGNLPVGHQISSSLNSSPETEQQGPDSGSPIEDGDDSKFQKLFNSFISTMESYRKTMSLNLDIAPLVVQSVATEKIFNFCKLRGKEIDHSDKSKMIFELGIEHYPELATRSKDVETTIEGFKRLPSIMVIGLISAYDAILYDILKTIFSTHVEMIQSSNKTIQICDLRNFTSIDQVIESQIHNEIETILRNSHHEQFAIMEKLLKIPLKKDLDVWGKFIELCERRNLLTHTGGIVSKQYISVCQDNGYDVSKLEIGSKLLVDIEYYTNAVSIIYEIGFKLIQVVWRKLFPDEIEIADTALNHAAYLLIQESAYGLADTILTFGCGVIKRHSSDRVRRMMVVNYANVKRLQKDQKGANKILADEDWSACSEEFEICVAAVRQDIDKLVECMRRTALNGTLTSDDYRRWPVFRGLKTNEKFSSAFEEIFGESLILERKIEILDPAVDKSPDVQVAELDKTKRKRRSKSEDLH